tara:strand:- start:6865 stop:6999 length:135 start_codon:yes stop_codon:yes gene_type:complete
MQQNYSKKKNHVEEPRPIVVRRILAFSKYYGLKQKKGTDINIID